MEYSIDQGIEILERTPDTLINLLSNLSDAWIFSDEGEHTWSPFGILGQSYSWLKIRLDIAIGNCFK